MFNRKKAMKKCILQNMKYLFIFSFLFLIASCQSDDNLEKKDTPEDLVAMAHQYLNGDIILGTHATMNGVNKTLLPQGCPTKFNFHWSETDKNVLTIRLENFSVGQMPFSITYYCDVKIIQLNSWEKNEYKGEGWIKFVGEDGYLALGEGVPPRSMKGSAVKGYYNVKTHEINFIVDYNMMNVRSECFLQTIDKARINNYEAEFKQYEADLAAYKKEHGL